MAKETFQVEYPEQDELLTVAEVAKQLRVDDTTVRRWITNGVLEAIILPHQSTRKGYRIKQSTLTTLLNTPALLQESGGNAAEDVPMQSSHRS